MEAPIKLSEKELTRIHQAEKYGFWGSIFFRSLGISLISAAMASIIGLLFNFRDYNSWFYTLSFSTLIPLIMHPFIDSRNLRIILKLHEMEKYLRKRIRIDEHTGAYSKQAFIELVNTELENPAYYPAAIIFIDINNFKQVNDQHGHIVGDEVLCQMADIIRGILRNRDVLGRFGGDEFVIFLPRTSPEFTDGIVKHIRRSLKNIQVDGTPIKIEISKGIETLQAPGPGLEVILQQADQAMYADKLNK